MMNPDASRKNAEGYADPTAYQAINNVVNSMGVEQYHATLEANMSEAEHQTKLFQALAAHESRYPEVAEIFHIPNGELRAKATAGRLRAMGVKPGIPDIFFPVPIGDYHGMFLELKSLKKHAQLSKAQEATLNRLRSRGYRVEVCRGWRLALEKVLEYLEGAQ